MPTPPPSRRPAKLARRRFDDSAGVAPIVHAAAATLGADAIATRTEAGSLAPADAGAGERAEGPRRRRARGGGPGASDMTTSPGAAHASDGLAADSMDRPPVQRLGLGLGFSDDYHIAKSRDIVTTDHV